MKRFIEGDDRSQVTLLPECLDDYVAEDNPVRVVDAFIEELDLRGVGLRWCANRRRQDGPSYHPSVLLKIYVYGYLNRVHSQSAPGARVPAQCRVDVVDRSPGAGLQDHRRLPARQRLGASATCCRQFVVLCRKLKLLARRRRGRRRQQVQGGQQPRPQLHAAQAAAAHEAGRRRASSATCRRWTPPTARSPQDLPAQDRAHLQDKLSRLRRQMHELGLVEEQLRGSPTAAVADRPRRPLHGHQWPRHRHRGLQRADRRRHEAPLHRRARGAQRRPRPHRSCRPWPRKRRRLSGASASG